MRGGLRIHILQVLVPRASCCRLVSRILHQIPLLPALIPCSEPDSTSDCLTSRAAVDIEEITYPNVLFKQRSYANVVPFETLFVLNANALPLGNHHEPLMPLYGSFVGYSEVIRHFHGEGKKHWGEKPRALGYLP